jgi:hypothetical protein
MRGTLQKICKWYRDPTDPAVPQSDGKAPERSSTGAAHHFEQVAKYCYDALGRNRDRRRCSPLTGVLEDAYAASVQLSHRPRTQVLEGRPSRSRGHG